MLIEHSVGKTFWFHFVLNIRKSIARSVDETLKIGTQLRPRRFSTILEMRPTKNEIEKSLPRECETNDL